MADNSTPPTPALPEISLAGAPPPTATTPPAALPHIPGYQIVRLIGAGGMGAVYEAWQEKPHRRVALKILPPALLSPGLLRRFSLEVEILGRLEHPAIAHIYDAGSAETNGLLHPFFAMEFIEGQTITQYTRQKDLPISKRITLLKQVVDGVHYAHQKGIIHRDLKPANILVGANGQPKILDFGVARVTEGDLQPTPIPCDGGEVIGTLSYMSPEQADGRVDEVDIRSDVYALGIIAFELLSGERPYRLQTNSIHEAARVIHEQEPARLGMLNRAFKGDLEIIVHKAMAKDKEQRYASASALSNDLQRYLNEEPIEARPPSTWYQVRKFARRHRVLVSAGAAVLAALVAGLALASIGLVQAKRAEEQAQQAQHEAEQQKERAQSNLQKALGTVDQFTTLVAQGELASIPEAAAVRKQLLNDAVAFYQQFVADNNHDAFSREELAWALTRLANIYRTAGDIAKTKDLLEQNAIQLGTLIAHDPQNANYQQRLAINLDELGRAIRNNGDLAAAQKVLEEALALKRKLVQQYPLVPEYQQGFARTLDELGSVFRDQKDYEQAVEYHEQALALKRTLVAQNPGNFEYQWEVATTLNGLGRLYRDTGDDISAQQAYEQALVIQRQQVQQAPQQAEHQRDLARTLNEQGRVLAKLGLLTAANDAFKESCELYRALLRGQPANQEFRKSLGFTLGNWANMLEGPDARLRLEEAQTIWRELSREEPRDDACRKALAWTERQLERLGATPTPQPAPVATPPAARLVPAPVPPTPTPAATNVLQFDALDLDGVRGAAGQYAIVRGRVHSVVSEVGRNQFTFINFDENAATIKCLIHRNVLPVFTQAYGENLMAVAGQPVEIEGIINVFDEVPQMVLNRPEQIRLQPVAATNWVLFSSRAIAKIRAQDGQVAVVEGRVIRVRTAPSGAITFLNFEHDGADMFTAIIRKDYLAAVTQALGGPPAERLFGKRIRVSGLVYLHQDAPNIEIRTPGQITLLAD